MLLLAKTLYGLEPYLADELAALGARHVNMLNRAVSFQGNQELLYRANLHSRLALSFLLPICTFEASNEEQFYFELKQIPWENYLDVQQTFAIHATVHSETFRHSQYISLKAKDAIVDYFREKKGIRPNVNKDFPDILLDLHISHQTCTISLNSSGESLHKRGYRRQAGEAPLNEVLAAAMVVISKWKEQDVLLDPFCGSGTILIEAAQIAARIAPGLYRKRFAFMNWLDFNEKLWKKLLQQAHQLIRKEINLRIYGSDISEKAIRIARQNVKNAHVEDFIQLTCISFEQRKPPFSEGYIITNPPYGERIGNQNMSNFYKSIGDKLKRDFAGYRFFIISSNLEAMKFFGLKPSHKWTLYNGGLACTFREYELFEGRFFDYKRRNSLQ
ncbi:MAG: THUMP domain-containing protein [Cytophagales bacterium]|nr:THUMP domain-containing protein [Cytophagales bacterium]MDW8383805.1 THUMP domain-containing protein [Flammeovirgaceae bacterium]